MPYSKYSMQASQLLSLLTLTEEDPDALILNGTRNLPVSCFLGSDWYCRQFSDVNVSISYNPIDIGDYLAKEGDRVLTLRKTPFGSVNDAGLAKLESLVRRRTSFHMKIYCCMSSYAAYVPDVYLRIPTEFEVDELIRLIRLHGRWPIPFSLLKQELAAESAYRWICRRADCVLMEYAGSRNVPPRFLIEHSFWFGRCVVSISATGTRHVPVCKLLTPNGFLILAVKPHTKQLYQFLHRHITDSLVASVIRVLPEGRRKPVYRLALATAPAFRH